MPGRTRPPSEIAGVTAALAAVLGDAGGPPVHAAGFAALVRTERERVIPLGRRPAREWHTDGMNRARLSTTVDAALLMSARSLRLGATDAALVDEALAALLARHRSAEMDASYAAYEEHPIDEPDEWGDLASFRRAAAAS